MSRSKSFFPIFIISCFFFTDSFCQFKVNGVIKDKNTGETLIGAAVLLKGTTIGGVTDIDGKFDFIVPETPPFILVISYLGYVNQEFEVKSAMDKINVGLSTDEVLMDEVEVVGERISEKQKESPLTIESMDVIAIKESPSADFYEGIGQLKGVDLTAASIGFKVINCRGFNSTSPVRSLQIIDGVDNQSPGLNFSLGNFLGASELDVMKMDLIVGASSAYYGPNAFNGVISMTSKNPFQFPGLSVMTKVGERNLFETSIRYAHVFKNKKEEEKLGVKFNLFFMRADDWEADNMDPTEESVAKDNWGGYDAVNRYGDEIIDRTTDLRDEEFQANLPDGLPGLGIFYRNGYLEKDLVDYNSRNVKAGTAFHYKLKPDVELIYASNFGTGTTVYQGDNRYALKNILFFQNRLEIKKNDKYFLRAYATNENAGKSYDVVFTAFLLQDAAKDNVPVSDNLYHWKTDYISYWTTDIIPQIKSLPDYPIMSDWECLFYQLGKDSCILRAHQVMNSNSDLMALWHQEARDAANSAISPDGHNHGYSDRFEPGTDRFNSEYNSIIAKPLSQGGTRFIDKSALYNIHGEYKFTPKIMDIIAGGNFRMYRPNSQGTIFSDTGGVKITNSEYGVYLGLEKKILDEKLKLNVTSRIDKNENFDFVMSPAASVVYTHNKNHIVRFSFSSAIRNPTLADQYLYYNVGRAILIGNIKGVDSLVTRPSLFSFFSYQKPDSLVYFDVAPIRPEKVKSLEVGYRTTLFNRIYLDASYYYSFYTDFIGYKLGIDLEYDSATKVPTYVQAYRVAANAKDMVTTQGVSVGGNYFFKKFYAINGNYSWNVLDLRGSTDPIIPAYNTPKHKFNIGISGRDVKSKIGLLNTVWDKLPVLTLINWGFSINYKWVEGFVFEGSPQFTGFVPAYDMLDAQINKYIPKWHATFKVGASNLLNKKNFQVYGGPRIGRLAYFSILVELDHKN